MHAGSGGGREPEPELERETQRLKRTKTERDGVRENERATTKVQEGGVGNETEKKV